MPAPPVSTAETFVGSADSTACFVVQVPEAASSCAALLSALSLVAMSLSAVWRAWTLDLRSPRRAFDCRSMLISWSTIDDVSTPDARPERPPSDMR